MIKELAGIIGVTEDTVINWEIRGIEPAEKSMERVKVFLEG